MKSKDEIRADLDDLEDEDAVQEYLENLWWRAKEEAYNIERMLFHFQWDELDLEDIKDILDNQDFPEVEHK